jgi:hypothetical protein
MPIAKAQFGVGDHIRRGSLVSEVTFDIVGRSKLRRRFQIWSEP